MIGSFSVQVGDGFDLIWIWLNEWTCRSTFDGLMGLVVVTLKINSRAKAYYWGILYISDTAHGQKGEHRA